MYVRIGSPDPKYLAATDVLIGDMSNINYEFLLLDRPIILIANNWLKDTFPDIGPKIHINKLEEEIYNALNNPLQFSKERKYWLNQTIEVNKKSASEKYINLMLSKSKLNNHVFCFITGGNSVRETNIKPLVDMVKKKSYPFEIVRKYQNSDNCLNSNIIFVGAHFKDLLSIKNGYKVHIDHDLKIGSANLKYAIWDYKGINTFLELTYIVAGKAGLLRTKKVLGPNAGRAIIAGYPKGDDLLL